VKPRLWDFPCFPAVVVTAGSSLPMHCRGWQNSELVRIYSRLSSPVQSQLHHQCLLSTGNVQGVALMSDSCTRLGISNDEVLRRTGLLKVSFIVRKRQLGLFGHVARLSHTIPASQILRICTKATDGERPSQEWRRACGRPPTTWNHQICRDTGVTATEALQLAEDRPF